MKIKHEHIDFPGKSTLKINYAKRPYFLHPWHFHEQHQIQYVIKSTGTRFVGDHVEPFGEGDLVLLAGNLPHFWRSSEIYYSGKPEYYVLRLTVQFPNDFIEPVISKYPEFLQIKQMMLRAERGIKFNPPDSERISKMLLKLRKLKGFQQVMHFIQTLYVMSDAKNTRLLASEGYQPGRNELTDDRLKKIIRFLSANYCDQVSFKELADIAGMHPVSLSRYFKEKTGKKITTYLNELRVGFACKLLLEGNRQVSHICYETGFNNLANFNRTFRKITQMTPKQYQNKFFNTEVKKM